MARPRVFISSTYYDFKSIREDLDRFVAGMGYEPIRHERGHIPYGREERPEAYAYREIEGCDILVSVIGGKIGTQSTGSDYSITQTELKKAFDLGKQIYIFVEKSVHSEFTYFKANKDVPNVRYTAVNDPKVYSFLEEIYVLPRGNPIFPFDTGADIATILREQWAGLFQRLLAQEPNKAQTNLTDELQRSLQTVDQLVKFLTEENTKGGSAINEILFSNHPIFDAIRAVTRNRYRVYFSSLPEFQEWLDAARGFSPVAENQWDSPEFMEWVRDVPNKEKKQQQILWVKKDLFGDDGRVKIVTQAEWQDHWVRSEIRDKETIPDIDDDDIPF